jgi:hypothetical protein
VVFVEVHHDSRIQLPLNRGEAIFKIDLLQAVNNTGGNRRDYDAFDAPVLGKVEMLEQDDFVLLWFHRFGVFGLLVS